MKRVVLFVFLLCLISSQHVFADVSFIYPLSNSWVNTQGHLVLRFNASETTALRVTVNGTPSEMIDVSTPEYRKLFQNFFIAQTIWDEGKNSLVVDLFKGGQKIHSANNTVYYLPPGKKMNPPPEFVPNVMHLPEREKLCIPCHTMNPTQKQMNSSVEKENPCFRCHKKIMNTKFVHGPAGTYSCGFCHGNKGTGPRYEVPRRGAELCYACHSDMREQLKKKKFIHGPVEAGLCEVCHDSHGSGYESQLHKAVNDLCITCHGNVSQKAHVTRDSMGGAHPLSGKSDPLKLKSGKPFSCISCHNPHGGDVRNFLVNNPPDRLSFCQMCHNK